MQRQSVDAVINDLIASGGNITATKHRAANKAMLDYAVPLHNYYLSNEGAISDADLSDNSVSFGTNNTAVIQAVFDKAQLHPITVYWDGQYSVTGIEIYSNTTIIAGAGCGAILRNNSNKPILQNKNRTNTGAFGNQFITIKGGKWHANGYNPALNPAQQDINGSDYETYLPGMKFHGVQYLRIDDVIMYKARVYGIWFRNCQMVWSNNCEIDAGADNEIHCDGYHFNGPCRYVWITNPKIRAVDDHIALNADDGYQTFGDITDFYCENVHFFGGIYGVRILSGTSRVDRVHFKGISGFTGDYWLVIDNFFQDPSFINSDGNGNVGTITFDDVDVDVNTISPYPHKACAVIACNCETIIFRNLKRNYFLLANYASVIVAEGKTINQLIIDGYSSFQKTVNLVQHIVLKNATIKNLILSNITVDKSTGFATDASNFLQVDGGTIGMLRINGFYVNKLQNFLKLNTGTISKMIACNGSHENAGGGATFAAGTTVQKGIFSNMDSALLTSGTFTSKTGDAT